VAAIEPTSPRQPGPRSAHLARLANLAYWGRKTVQLLGRMLGVLGGGMLASGGAKAVDLPPDRADLMYHRYDGGGVVAQGPAVLVRKSLADKVSLSGSYYVDAVSNASIDVVTTASPFRETRNEYGLGLSYAQRDNLMSLSLSRSKEPDYLADNISADMAQEVFGGMTTVSTGFSKGHDKIGQHGSSQTYLDSADHWQYRLGATQILSPRWLMSLNTEALYDAGFLGNEYRAARVFGALVPERNPRTRSARAIKLRAVGDVGQGEQRASVNFGYRHYWDNWGIRANTLEGGYSRYLQGGWLVDGFVRWNRQSSAAFYSDNAQAETTYISRSRQLSSFTSTSVGGRGTGVAASVPGRYELKLTGSLELVKFDYANFTDLRTGKPYSFTGHLVQLQASATF
jgi:hypothetical protein